MKRVLLDNCVPRDFAALLTDLEAVHVSARGWEGLTNGRLLDAAEGSEFEVIVTVDKNFSFQQNLGRRRIALVTLDTLFSRIQDLAPLVPRLQESLVDIAPGTSLTIRDHPSE